MNENNPAGKNLLNEQLKQVKKAIHVLTEKPHTSVEDILAIQILVDVCWTLISYPVEQKINP